WLCPSYQLGHRPERGLLGSRGTTARGPRQQRRCWGGDSTWTVVVTPGLDFGSRGGPGLLPGCPPVEFALQNREGLCRLWLWAALG
ncbi:hypothetical protein EI555_013299, partial [Monodon monoceros]